MTLHTWFVMGGYGLFVWPAWAGTFTVFLAVITGILRDGKKIRRKIHRYYRSAQPVFPKHSTNH